MNDRAAKVFEILISEKDNEAAAAYERLCAMGARMEDVATHIGGKVWESKITHTRFEEVDDTPLLPGR